MLIMTSKGLFCPLGNFYIDPKRAVEHAVITHAHSDHARKGSRQYYCTRQTVSLLKTRLGDEITVHSKRYDETFYFGEVMVSFHPAGHILGSAQVRIEYAGEVWVVSGDYKREPDLTCDAFETVECDVFVTEATFGTPSFVWDKQANIDEAIFNWWKNNARRGINSVLFAYSLGKAQRVLSLLFSYSDRPIYCDAATQAINECYRDQQVLLAPTLPLEAVKNKKSSGELFIVPPMFLKSEKSHLLGQRYETAFASGWTARGGYANERGFLLSDHADWNDLIQTIVETKAKRVYVQHRGKGALVRHLKSLGLEAYPDTELMQVEPSQIALFE